MTVSGQGFGGAAYSLAIRLGLTSAESSSTSPLSSDFLYRKYTRLPEIFQGSLSSDFLFRIGNMLGSSIQCLSMGRVPGFRCLGLRFEKLSQEQSFWASETSTTLGVPAGSGGGLCVCATVGGISEKYSLW